MQQSYFGIRESESALGDRHPEEPLVQRLQ